MRKRLVDEWIVRGEHDLEAAKLILDRKGHYDTILFHLHQAVEKCLKGYLIQRGWKLRKIHDIESLLTYATEFDKSFEEYLDLGRKLTAFYYEDRYPPGPVQAYLEGEVENALEMCEKLIEKILKGT